jgi:hypothetical protein
MLFTSFIFSFFQGGSFVSVEFSKGDQKCCGHKGDYARFELAQPLFIINSSHRCKPLCYR